MLGQIVAQGQRAAAASGRVAEVLATDPQIVDHPHPRHLPVAKGATAPLGEVRFDACHLLLQRPGPAHPRQPRPRRPARLVGRARRRDRIGQDDHRSPHPALLRRDRRAASRSTASTCATCACTICDAAIGIVFEDTFLFNDTVAANIAFADPDASDEAVLRAVTTGGRARLHRRSCPTATTRSSASVASRCRVASVSASRIAAGDRRRPARADPRRRHQRRRSDEGARDP